MTTIRSGAPVAPPAQVTTAAPAVAAQPQAAATAPADTFTPASNGNATGTMSGQAIQQKGLDALDKIGTDDAKQLAALLKKPNLNNADVTQLQQLCQNLSGTNISDADKAAIGDATTSKMIDKGISDAIVDQIKDMMQKAKVGIDD